MIIQQKQHNILKRREQGKEGKFFRRFSVNRARTDFAKGVYL